MAAVALIQWATSSFSMSQGLLVYAVALVAAFIVLRKIFPRASDQETAGNDVNQY
jgi:hypothetical protein